MPAWRRSRCRSSSRNPYAHGGYCGYAGYVHNDEGLSEARTSVTVYHSDLSWLKRRQLSVSNTAGEWMPLFDVIHGLIQATIKAEEGA
jgi:hypothetical protein